MDAVLGTTSYEEIAGAIREALKGEKHWYLRTLTHRWARKQSGW